MSRVAARRPLDERGAVLAPPGFLETLREARYGRRDVSGSRSEEGNTTTSPTTVGAAGMAATAAAARAASETPYANSAPKQTISILPLHTLRRVVVVEALGVDVERHEDTVHSPWLSTTRWIAGKSARLMTTPPLSPPLSPPPSPVSLPR